MTSYALKHLTDQDLSQNWVGLNRKKLANKHTDYVVLPIWAIGGPNFGRPVIKMVANATGRVLILLPVYHDTYRKPYVSRYIVKWYIVAPLRCLPTTSSVPRRSIDPGTYRSRGEHSTTEPRTSSRLCSRTGDRLFIGPFQFHWSKAFRLALMHRLCSI